MNSPKFRSICLLLIAQVAVLSLWFVSAAVLPDMLKDTDISSFRQAAMSSGVQAGFVVGALLSAVLGLADRYDPRWVLAVSAISAGLVNGLMLVAEPGGNVMIAARFLIGALLAGVYPVGMKIAVGWGQADRGFLVGALVGALTVGSAAPHLIAFAGGTDWKLTVSITCVAAIAAGLLMSLTSLGPYHATAPKFSAKAVTMAWTNKRIRLAYCGYLGHMWELYAMWAWVGTAVAVSYSHHMSVDDAQPLAKLTAFAAIAGGGLVCAYAGRLADKIGKADVTIIAMALSGTSAVLTAATFGGTPWITFVLVVIWGITIIPDSAQFSALVADASPPDQAGSLMTFQTALGFALTFVTVQVTPLLAQTFGWPTVLAGLAIGPAAGILAMVRLRHLTMN